MFSVIHSDGSSDTTPPTGSLPDLFDELRTADREHGDVSVVHEESGWALSAHRDGRLVFENLSTGGQRYMTPVTRDRVLELWQRLADGDVDGLLSEPWRSGYGP
jgi:hypothetical protein